MEGKRRGRVRRTGERSGSGQRETWSRERAAPLKPTRIIRVAPQPGRFLVPAPPPAPPDLLAPLPGGMLPLFTLTRIIRVSLKRRKWVRSLKTLPGEHARTQTHHGRNQARRSGLALYTRKDAKRSCFGCRRGGQDPSHYPSPAARARSGGAREGRRCGGIPASKRLG